jgi:antitoxin PrlF
MTAFIYASSYRIVPAIMQGDGAFWRMKLSGGWRRDIDHVMHLHYLLLLRWRAAMNVRPTIEIEATITERGQTTVPAAIRKMLGIQKGAIVFKGMPDGTVIIEPKPAEDEEDPVIAKFLAFLARDIEQNPQNLVPFDQALMDEVDELVAGVEVDMDARLEDD